MDGVFDALVAAAPADISGQGFADLVVRRFWIIHQQRRCLHDLAGLAKAALRDIELAPGLLNRVVARRMKAFDRRDLPIDHVGNRRDAGAHRLLVDDDGALTAEGLAAPALSTPQAPLIAANTQQ